MTHVLTSPDGTPASRFAFGTMQFGGRADAGESRAMFDDCIDAGITHFDTAYVYTEGASETLLGDFAGPLRDRLIIATKAGYVGGAAPDNLRTQFDTSRQRLQMDMVDILYLHRFDPDTDLRESLDTLLDLRDAGQIRYIGLSNFAAWQVMKAQAMTDNQIAIIQPMYNLLKRQAEVELLPMAADQGITVAPYSPLGGGMLTGKYARGETGRLTEDDRYAARYGLDWMADAAACFADLADGVGTHPATLAAVWVAAHPSQPSPILSARTVAQLKPSLDAIPYRMDPELYAQITALSPTPPPATDRIEEA